MTPLDISYRVWTGSVPAPQSIKVPIPGWGGRKDDDHAQPWHCKPFLDGNSLGFELYWGIPGSVEITGDGTDANFAGDWVRYTKAHDTIAQFAPGHYGVNTNYALQFPDGWDGLILPHPSFALDPYSSDLPAIIPGVLEFAWWPKLFFVVGRVPPPGITQRLTYGKPFCQVVPVPHDLTYALRPMTADERFQHDRNARLLDDHYRFLSTKNWVDGGGHHFGNIYKLLAAEYRRVGRIDWAAIGEHIKQNAPS